MLKISKSLSALILASLATASTTNASVEEFEVSDHSHAQRVVTGQLSDEQKNNVLAYLFIKKYRSDPESRILDRSVNTKEIFTLLQALQNRGSLHARAIGGVIGIYEKSRYYKKCKRYMNNGLINKDNSGNYVISPEGEYALELLMPFADLLAKRTKRARAASENEDAGDDSEQGMQKKVHNEFHEDSDKDINVNRYYNPKRHHALLNAFDGLDELLTAELIYIAMGKFKPGKNWEKAKSNFVNYYLKEHVQNGWLSISESEGEKNYAITDRGLKAKNLFEERFRDEEDIIESDDAPSDAGKRQRRGAAISQVEADGEFNQDFSSVTGAEPSERNSNAPPKKNPKMKASAESIEKPAEADRDDVVENVVPRQLRLEQLPLPVQELFQSAVRTVLIPEILADEGFISSIKQTVLASMSARLQNVFYQKYEIQPGNALENLIELNITLASSKNED